MVQKLGKEAGTPATDANYAQFYAKGDGLLYYLDTGGVEHLLSGLYRGQLKFSGILKGDNALAVVGSATDMISSLGTTTLPTPGGSALYPWIDGPATFDGLGVWVGQNTLTQPTTFTLFKNSVATPVTVTFAAGVTNALFDVAHSFAIIQGDLLELRVAIGAAGGAANQIGFTATARYHVP